MRRPQHLGNMLRLIYRSCGICPGELHLGHVCAFHSSVPAVLFGWLCKQVTRPYHVICLQIKYIFGERETFSSSYEISVQKIEYRITT